MLLDEESVTSANEYKSYEYPLAEFPSGSLAIFIIEEAFQGFNLHMPQLLAFWFPELLKVSRLNEFSTLIVVLGPLGTDAGAELCN